jgi:hypothetical protein
MGCLEGSGVPVLYIGRAVLEGFGWFVISKSLKVLRNFSGFSMMICSVLVMIGDVR